MTFRTNIVLRVPLAAINPDCLLEIRLCVSDYLEKTFDLLKLVVSRYAEYKALLVFGDVMNRELFHSSVFGQLIGESPH